MKKRRHLLFTAIMLTILTACSPVQTQGKDQEQTGTESSAHSAEPAKPSPGTEASKPETAPNAENTAFPERTYESDIIYYNELSGGFHLRKNVEKTQTDYATYYFEIPISEQERNACISATDKMLSSINTMLPDIEIVVLTQKSYDGISISGNRLYLPPQPWESGDYFAKVLLAGYGGWGNYGLAYGYADYLYRKPESDNAKSAPLGREADSLHPMNTPKLYDLNLLCFDERFASQKDVEAARNNACLFVKDYLASHSEAEFLELLAASGTAEGVALANEALEAFYAKNGIKCSLTGIRYQPGGAAADYAAACEYACFYLYKDWQDFTWEQNPKVSENFLHEDYVEVREFFESNAHQMGQYQKLFGFDSYNNALTVYLKNNKGISADSFYNGFKHTINLESVVSLMHEYIHSLMFGRCDWESQWKVEGTARYFSYKFDLYSHDFLNDDWNSATSSMKCIQEYINTMGGPKNVQTDFREVENILVYVQGQADPNFSYTSGSSFIGYLVDQYGEQAVISYICSDNEYNAEWDKSYGVLVQNGWMYIEANYSQYNTDAM